MAKSLSLALYLATRARSDRAVSAGMDGEISAEEMRGISHEPRPPNAPLIWFHTGQDRTSQAAAELANRMQSERGDLQFLLTTSAGNRLKSKGYLHRQLAPDDVIPSVQRFLDHWQPDIAVFTEPDLRPALIAESSDRDIPLFLIDANTAKPDPQAWRWFRGMSESLLERFQWVTTGSATSANALKKLGANPDKLETAGYLEEGTPALPCNEAERDDLAEGLGARPVWLAAHVGTDELDAVLQAHSHAQRRAHRLLLILVPDTAENAAQWYAKLVADGHNVSLRSTGAEPHPDEQIYIAEPAEEMGLWYRLAPISFLGKSLFSGEGANPYEPAALGSAVIHGPHISEFSNAYDRLGAGGAARLVTTGEELGDAVEQLLSPDRAATMAQKAWAICSSGAELTDRVLDLILTELEIREGL